MVKNLPAVQETQLQSLGWEGPLEKGMATHSSILGLENCTNRGLKSLQSKGLSGVYSMIASIIFNGERQKTFP